MENQGKMPVFKRLKTWIIILCILLTLSAGGLAARYIYLQYFATDQTTETLPDNLIGDGDSSVTDSGSDTDSTGEIVETSNSGVNGTSEADEIAAQVLELYEGRPEANKHFEVKNMLPGDVETGYFCVRTYHDSDIELFFRTDVTGQTKDLGDVLQITVTCLDTGKTLLSAPFNRINGSEFSEILADSADGRTMSYYRVDVYLDTSVGNDYQSAMLESDFKWYVKDDGKLTAPPKTGDRLNTVLWTVLAVSSVMLLICLWKRKKEGRQNE